MYSIIYEYQNKLNYFLLWTIVQYYFILLLKLSLLWPLKSLLVGFYVTVTYSHYYIIVMIFFKTSL